MHLEATFTEFQSRLTAFFLLSFIPAASFPNETLCTYWTRKESDGRFARQYSSGQVSPTLPLNRRSLADVLSSFPSFPHHQRPPDHSSISFIDALMLLNVAPTALLTLAAFVLTSAAPAAALPSTITVGGTTVPLMQRKQGVAITKEDGTVNSESLQRQITFIRACVLSFLSAQRNNLTRLFPSFAVNTKRQSQRIFAILVKLSERFSTRQTTLLRLRGTPALRQIA